MVALLVATDRRRPRSYRWLALAPLLLVLAQAVLGGIIVIFDLNPAFVGIHLLISMTLVALSTWLVLRFREGDAPASRSSTRPTGCWCASSVAGSPRSSWRSASWSPARAALGDENVGYRFAVDPWLMAKVHAAAVWAFLLVLVVLLVRLRRAGATGRLWRTALLLLGVALAQGAIGYVQLLTGLPIGLVNLHMLGAALLSAGVASFVWSTRTRGPATVRGRRRRAGGHRSLTRIVRVCVGGHI